MNTARILAAGIAVGLSSFVLTGCQPSEEKKAAPPAAAVETAKPAVQPAATPAVDPAAAKPKDHPAH